MIFLQRSLPGLCRTFPFVASLARSPAAAACAKRKRAPAGRCAVTPRVENYRGLFYLLERNDDDCSARWTLLTPTRDETITGGRRRRRSQSEAAPNQKSESNNAITAGTQQLMFCADAFFWLRLGWLGADVRAGRERKLVKWIAKKFSFFLSSHPRVFFLSSSPCCVSSKEDTFTGRTKTAKTRKLLFKIQNDLYIS